MWGIQHMGVMVYNGKSIDKWMIWGSPQASGNHSDVLRLQLHHAYGGLQTGHQVTQLVVLRPQHQSPSPYKTQEDPGGP